LRANKKEISNPIPLDRAQKVGPETCVIYGKKVYLRQIKANQDRVQ